MKKYLRACDEDPEVGALALLLGAHEDAGRVGAQVRRLEGVAQHRRREVLGRKNWLFLGSDEGTRTNTIFVSLLARCQLHGIEPWAYLRDFRCVLPSWPRSRVLELAPAFWK
ncbi:hypothetical protein [Nannocystis radixulma]|uniref:IS66 C-terminal element n=1 Tax=Nannocystis radixulma TaxID=2995305 RepID=A0ABT5BPC4_9BACT|nr:hypothetical protein [Nannocystis radixulma]MDC0674766.1 hypothetical protein [Nannocystis radixulma]